MAEARHEMSQSDALGLTPERRAHLLRVYRDGLLSDTLPFWINHSVDREHGGFLTCLDHDGAVLDTDKGIWVQGRFSWLLATLYQTVEARPEWLDLARHGVDFLRRAGFDDDGRMFFLVTQDGQPLRKRRYLFSEAFTVGALAAYGHAAGDQNAVDQAVDLFHLIERYLTSPGLLAPKVDPGVRPSKGLAMPMILIATAQILRRAVADPAPYTVWIDRCIAEIQRDFMKPPWQAVLETVGPNGEFQDHMDGRLLNPGHAIEAAWFILHEAKLRGRDQRLIDLGTTILDWMWQWGWDRDYGGIIYFRDVKGLPVQEYWQDMKFWWPQNEAIIATLLAYQLTGDPKYAAWHTRVHDWAYSHFPDPTHGEWFGYLHRDGRLAQRAKGNLWKGPFHLPRMQLTCWQILTEMAEDEAAQ